jgi:hypothetical protein
MRKIEISKKFSALILFWATIALISTGGCGPTLKQVQLSDRDIQSEKQKQLEIAFDTFIKRQKRLYEISYPLLSAAAGLKIEDATPICGFNFCTKDGFPKEYQEIAQRYFNLDDKPVVFFVHPKFPAAKAGLKLGDRLISFNGNVLAGKPHKEVLQIIQENPPLNNQPICLVVGREGQIVELKTEGLPCCKYPVVLVPNDQINAASDGKNIIINSGLIRIAESNDELALVIAHEIAHNVLGHIGKRRGNVLLGSVFDILILATTGVSTGGLFGKVGGAAYSKSYEFEADYAGLYIAARAGYDITNAPNFWRRIATEHPKSMEKSFAASHPSTPERFVAMEKTIQEIKEKQRLGKPLIPELKEKRSDDEPGGTTVTPKAGDAPKQEDLSP